MFIFRRRKARKNPIKCQLSIIPKWSWGSTLRLPFNSSHKCHCRWRIGDDLHNSYDNSPGRAYSHHEAIYRQDIIRPTRIWRSCGRRNGVVEELQWHESYTTFLVVFEYFAERGAEGWVAETDRTCNASEGLSPSHDINAGIFRRRND